MTTDGCDIDLGRHGSKESRAEDDRLIAESLTNGRHFSLAERRAPTDLSVNELLAAYWRSRASTSSRPEGDGGIPGHATAEAADFPVPVSESAS